MKSPKVIILQHVECEPPGTYTPFLAKRGELTTVRLDLDQAITLPDIDLDQVAAVIAMGGPMGVYETELFPWIDDELAFIAQVVEAEVPFLGVCLGAQLLAGALGGDVYVGDRPEVGIGDIHFTSAAESDPVLGGLRPSVPVLQWHSDTFTLPDGATLLASSDHYEHQAFCVGSAYGLQFHAETTWELASQWLALSAYRQSIEQALGPDGAGQLARELQAATTEITATADHVIDNWLTTFVDPRQV
jgi:GMP synthase (glutamine-hydrolysing)